MQVGGKKPDKDLWESSDNHSSSPVLCQPCSNGGNFLPAHGYCKTCIEYLCKTCYTAHTIPSPLRHHVLLDKSRMPNTAPTSYRNTKQSVCTLPCPDHADKFIEYLCPVHDSVVCGVCAVLKHKPCAVEYIPDLDIALTYKDSAEYKQICVDLDMMHKDATASIDYVKKINESIGDELQPAVEDIRIFRKEMNAYLNKREEELLRKGVQLEREERDLTNELSKDLTSVKVDIERSTDKLTSLEGAACNLFAASFNIRKQIPGYYRSLVELVAKNKITNYNFTRNNNLKLMVSSRGIFGTLERSYQARGLAVSVPTNSPSILEFKTATVTILPAINIMTPQDELKPLLTGLTSLCPNKILAVDRYNSTLKEIDTRANTLTSQLSLPGRPWDLTLLPMNQAAITLPENQNIIFISTKGRLSLLRSISVNGECYGIASVDSNIVVSYGSPSKIEIMNVTGRVMKTVTKGSRYERMYTGPEYIAVGRELSEEKIYRSNFETSIITKVSIKGKVLGKYKHTQFRDILGLICVGEGQGLICNSGRNTVDVVRNDGMDAVTLLDRTHGIERPRALCFCPEQATLYVSSDTKGGTISLFKLSNNIQAAKG